LSDVPTGAHLVVPAGAFAALLPDKAALLTGRAAPAPQEDVGRHEHNESNDNPKAGGLVAAKRHGQSTSLYLLVAKVQESAVLLSLPATVRQSKITLTKNQHIFYAGSHCSVA
jgi:hypothetical protein